MVLEQTQQQQIKHEQVEIHKCLTSASWDRSQLVQSHPRVYFCSHAVEYEHLYCEDKTLGLVQCCSDSMYSLVEADKEHVVLFS